MGKNKISHEHRCTHRLQVVYTRKTEKRKIFMEELKDGRRDKDKRVLKNIKDSIGPIWYQVLSVPQRNALDTLEFSIYQDLLEARPKRTARIIHILGIYPQPGQVDLINCVYAGRKDPKETFAYLFLLNYGHYFYGKRSSYDLNARLMLSALFYLGLNDLIKLLEVRFWPDTEPKPPPPKPKRKKPPPLASPYLEKLIAFQYEPKKIKRQPPPPLPNLDDIDNPYDDDDEPTIRKPPPPPPPPPPPKKRLPRSYCDRITGGAPKFQIYDFGLLPALPVQRKAARKLGADKLLPQEGKKVYGIDTGLRKKSSRNKKPTPIHTGIWNMQYLIQGVCTFNEKRIFVIGNVSILPSSGELIHGGFALVNGTYVNIHCGFTSRPGPNPPPPCDCFKKYRETVFRYIKNTSKCYCDHHYDYGNEGTFPSEEMSYFEKPTSSSPFRFNYNTIYELNPRMTYVEREFKRVWDTDSVIHENAIVEKKEKKKKRNKASSRTCLGTKPSVEDFLRCALRQMKRVNIAASLPDIHLVPELKEWMRRRLHGPFTENQKKKLLHKSINHWNFLKFVKGIGHVAPPQDPAYLGFSTWAFKQELSERFKKFAFDYKLAMFTMHAKLNNIMWATMCEAQFPDKKFREIFFSYLAARMPDIQIMHPYSFKESADRMLTMAKRRYRCPLVDPKRMQAK